MGPSMCEPVFISMQTLELQSKNGYLDTEAVLSALEACRVSGEALTLRLPAGELRVRRDRLPEYFVALSNNDSGMKRVAFPLRGLKDIVIKGRETRLILEGEILPFDVEACANVSFRGFSVDWERPFHFEGTVRACDESARTFDIEPSRACLWEIRDGRLWWVEKQHGERSRAVWHNGFGTLVADARWERTLGWNIWIDPSERAVARDSHECLFGAFDPDRQRFYRAERLEPDRIRIHQAGLKRLPQPGWVFVDKGSGGNRRFPAFHLKDCKDVVLEDVTIHHADGMGLIAEFSENIRLSRVNVLPSPGRAISTTADATHFVYCRGLIRLEGCRFECMPDDGINMHGNYYAVAEVSEQGHCWIAPTHPQHEHVDFARVGDRIARVDPRYFRLFSEHEVRGVERRNGVAIRLECEPPLPQGAVGQVLENLGWQADLEMVDCLVRGNRARAALFSTRGRGRIERNRFEDQSMMAVLVEMDADYWNETGPVGSLEIRDNDITHPAREFSRMPAIQVTPESGGADKPPIHDTIRIEGNRISVDNGPVLAAGSIRRLVWRDNQITGVELEEEGAVLLRGCASIEGDLQDLEQHAGKNDL